MKVVQDEIIRYILEEIEKSEEGVEKRTVEAWANKKWERNREKPARRKKGGFINENMKEIRKGKERESRIIEKINGRVE